MDGTATYSAKHNQTFMGAAPILKAAGGDKDVAKIIKEE
jgi:hypothetical protein